MAPAQISESQFQEKEKEHDIRSSNILAAKAVADMIRTSLGPRGMDKMIARPNGEVLITNDGATIMNELKLTHPAAQMIVELSKAQDVEAGDGTTSVVVVAGALLACCQSLFSRGIHPSIISDGFKLAVAESMKILQDIAIPVNLSDRESLIQAASTSLNSKVVSQYSSLLAPLAVDAVLQVIDPATATNVELKDIRITTKLGGTIDDTKLVHGLIFSQGAVHRAQGPARVEGAKIGLIQFCLSSPKSNMDNQVVLNDYTKMDRFINEERRYLLNLCRKIKKTGCNVLLIQKSILRDAVNDISLKFLAEMKILVIKDVERSDVNFICKTVGCQPAASIETFTAEKLGKAELVEEEGTSGGKVVLVTGVPASKTVSVLCRGSNKLVIAESERSVHDALCVVRSLVKSKFMIAGGGAPEIELSLRLSEYAKTVNGLQTHCIKAFAEALEIIPYTLAENAGLSPISIVTELRNRHAKHGEIRAGINVRKGAITDIREENVLQPLLVTQSCLQLATETVCMILKIDDILSCR